MSGHLRWLSTWTSLLLAVSLALAGGILAAHALWNQAPENTTAICEDHPADAMIEDTFGYPGVVPVLIAHWVELTEVSLEVTDDHLNVKWTLGADAPSFVNSDDVSYWRIDVSDTPDSLSEENRVAFIVTVYAEGENYFEVTVLDAENPEFIEGDIPVLNTASVASGPQAITVTVPLHELPDIPNEFWWGAGAGFQEKVEVSGSAGVVVPDFWLTTDSCPDLGTISFPNDVLPASARTTATTTDLDSSDTVPKPPAPEAAPTPATTTISPTTTVFNPNEVTPERQELVDVVREYLSHPTENPVAGWSDEQIIANAKAACQTPDDMLIDWATASPEEGVFAKLARKHCAGDPVALDFGLRDELFIQEARVVTQKSAAYRNMSDAEVLDDAFGACETFFANNNDIEVVKHFWRSFSSSDLGSEAGEAFVVLAIEEHQLCFGH